MIKVSVKNDHRFIKTDDNRIINPNLIRWVKKINDCLEVCTKTDGCYIPPSNYNPDTYKNKDTHTISKLNSPESFQLLNQYFE